MDETDLGLLSLLILDSRRPYRDLAEATGLSVQAVHRRIQALQDGGVIRGFTARLSVSYLNALKVTYGGVAKVPPSDEVVERVREEGSTETLCISTGNLVSAVGLMRDPSGIEPYLEFLDRMFKLEHPFPMGILSVMQLGGTASGKGPPTDLELRPLDYRIAKRLSEDSRTPVATIAGELGVSTKTVARRLERMVSGNALEFSLDYELGAAAGSTAEVFIALKPAVSKEPFRQRLTERLGGSLHLLATFSNLPDKAFCIVWAPTNAAVGGIVDGIRGDECVLDAKSFGLYSFRHFDTWRHRVLLERAEGH